MPEHQGLLLILDGLGDRGIAGFDGRTPLEAAHTPNLDQLIGAGQGALVDPLFPGVPVGTHTGTGVLMGIPPTEIARLARGPVEMAGTERQAADGDILIRCNFATLEENDQRLRVIDRRAGRIREHTGELAHILEDIDLGAGIRGTLIPATQHRTILQLRGQGLSAEITNTDPGSDLHDLVDCRATRATAAAERTARAVNRFTRIARQRLDRHPVNQQRRENGQMPANGVICRSAGVRHAPSSLIHHMGLKAALISGESTVIGLGRLLNYRVFTQPGFTALPETDLSAKIAAAETALKEHDLVFLHIKGPDICAHDLDPEGKRGLLERVDAALAPLLHLGLVIGVTGDHSTDSNSGKHVGDPVPSLLVAPHGRRDHCSRFGEADCAAGGLGRVSATGFLCAMLDSMGWLHRFKPEDIPFFQAPANGGS